MSLACYLIEETCRESRILNGGVVALVFARRIG